MSDAFPIQNCLKQGDALSSLLPNFALGYSIRNVQENKEELKSNGTHHLLVYKLLCEDINVIKNNTGALSDASKKVGLAADPVITKYMFMSLHQTTGDMK
jgi:hypothetical protein